MRPVDPRYSILVQVGLLLLCILSFKFGLYLGEVIFEPAGRASARMGCASENMRLTETTKGFRCADGRGNLFLPPFKSKVRS
ncbi:hypothetical protein [Methylobacterium sp. WL120]|uniref:hypothetical protein n=1 Tax=Methylobacterium sp. WL120 TaxID=2603887 RepID=UPI0011C76E36|nr:hypothetical protein [Methylobacterium sp. WL120]TXM68174.1 hypothetical protein FV229_08340 [Methylobacterium sp. WL120]